MEADTLIVGEWQPRYRTAGGDFGLAWDSCLSGGNAWIMDCGDIVPVRKIHTTLPNGRFEEAPGSGLSWRQEAPWAGPQRLIRLSLGDRDDVESIEPFGVAGGGIIAPPVDVPEHHRVGFGEWRAGRNRHRW